DLYYRINEASVLLPPLRERSGDAVLLAHAFLRRFSSEHGQPRRGFTEDAVGSIRVHPWPGNVRELESRVKTAVLVADEPLVSALDLGLETAATGQLPRLNLREARAAAERAAVLQATSVANGSISRAAE